jgi:hypothetical protein
VHACVDPSLSPVHKKKPYGLVSFTYYGYLFFMDGQFMRRLGPDTFGQTFENGVCSKVLQPSTYDLDVDGAETLLGRPLQTAYTQC